LFAERVDQAPGRYLASAGGIFTRFDRQDSGNVSYGVEVDGARFFVKTAGHPDDHRPPLDHRQRVALLGNAIRLARAYRHPALPRLHRVVESPHGPMLVYDWAGGELLGARARERDHPASAFQRFRHLPVDRIVAVLDTVFDVHALLGAGGEVAGDFYDGCLLYDFATGRLSLVDLDHYSPGPYRNTMGRMFGSSRFMAPEEFTAGALIDERTTVFTMGRTVLVFLAGGTTAPEAFRGPRALYEVAARACREQPDQRYGSLPEFCAAWTVARGAAGPARLRPARPRLAP
jgi:serine/threonine-protein kinase